MDRLKDKVAIITGSTSGIGMGIAKLYAAEGAQVIVCGRRADKGQGVVDSILAEGGKAAFHAMDITDPASIEALVADTAATYGKIDILVNNAANVSLPDGRVDELTIEMWDAIFQSDLRGTFYVTKCVLPYMRKDAPGRLHHQHRLHGFLRRRFGLRSPMPVPRPVWICSLKSVALQYGKDNVRCNCVRPGLIITPDNEAKVPQALKDIFLSNIMVNRYGCPEDIGHACVYFGSDESAYVTGQIITVDGGLNSHAPTVAQFRAMGSRTW